MKAKSKGWKIVTVAIFLACTGFMWPKTEVQALSTGYAEGILPWYALVNASDVEFQEEGTQLGGNLSVYADNSISDPVQDESTSSPQLTVSTTGAFAGSAAFIVEFGPDTPTPYVVVLVDPPAGMSALAEASSFVSYSGINVAGTGEVSIIFPFYMDMRVTTDMPTAESAFASLRFEAGYEYYGTSENEYLSGSDYHEESIETAIGMTEVEYLYDLTDIGVEVSFLIPEEWGGSGELTIWTKAIAHAEAASAVPEPATMLLLGSGLISLIGFKGRFRKR